MYFGWCISKLHNARKTLRCIYFRFDSNSCVYFSTEVTGETFGSYTLLCHTHNLQIVWQRILIQYKQLYIMNIPYLQPVSYLVLTYISWIASHSVWHLVLIMNIMNLACKMCDASIIQKVQGSESFILLVCLTRRATVETTACIMRFKIKNLHFSPNVFTNFGWSTQ